MGYRDREYSYDEIVAFLRAVDGYLTRPASVIIIGGAAAAFHLSTSMTSDVDTYEALPADLRVAIARAAAESGLDIPIQHSGVAELPYNFEDRLERRIEDLQQLEVKVVEKHDLALSKIIRGVDHDEQQILKIHAASPLNFDVLVDRFRDEMKYAVGNVVRHRQQLLQMIELLFGEMRRVEANKRLG